MVGLGSPLVDRLDERYRCLFRICPSTAKSAEQRPFEIATAAGASGRPHPFPGGTGRAHVVGLFTRGSGRGFNCLPQSQNSSIGRCFAELRSTRCRAYGFTKLVVGRLARTRLVPDGRSNVTGSTRHGRLPFPNSADYREDERIMTGARLVQRRDGVLGVRHSRGAWTIAYSNAVPYRATSCR